MKQKREDVRNVAIIAHVDHGKTTLVDELLKQSGVFRANQEVVERVMDSNAIERERGITILSKNTAITYKGVKINIVDTPGHADFGGEVERVLKMVNGVILVVDAFEGPMPQTKFVLRKALELQLPVIVCVNKIDRPEARPNAVVDEVLELFMDLDANDEQLDCPFVFASAKNGSATLQLTVKNKDMKPLLDTILDYIPAPEGDPDAGTQVLISTIDYNEYVGRIGVGKVDNGIISEGQDVVIVNHHEPDKQKRAEAGRQIKIEIIGGSSKASLNFKRPCSTRGKYPCMPSMSSGSLSGIREKNPSSLPMCPPHAAAPRRNGTDARCCPARQIRSRSFSMQTNTATSSVPFLSNPQHKITWSTCISGETSLWICHLGNNKLFICNIRFIKTMHDEKIHSLTTAFRLRADILPFWMGNKSPLFYR